MNLLVSDYDGTLKSNEKNLIKNIYEIKKFMNNNLFCIATGRPYSSIKKEINKYNIPYDYLICNNGLNIFDNYDNLLYSKCFNEEELMLIRNYLTFNKLIYKCYNLYGNICNNDVVYIDVIKNNLFKNLLIKKEIVNIVENVSMYAIMNHLYIESKINKAEGIRTLLKTQNISVDNIYTVGDAGNDIEMLKEFNGRKMLYSRPVLYGKGIKTCMEVHTYVKKIMR